MKLERHHEWPQRLSAVIASASSREFQWGTFDCAMFVCDCILAMTGRDLAAEFRGKYSDQDEADVICGRNLDGLAARVCDRAAMPEVAPTMAGRGDVVWVDNGTPDGALAIVSLDGRFAACVTDQGLVLVRMHRWRRAWKV